jgi:hypothetical protein
MLSKLFVLGPSLAIAATISVAACSSSSSGGGSSGYSCPAVGTKACPNDTPITMDLYNACQKCISQGQALVACDPNANKTNCDSMGMSQYKPPASCMSQYNAVVTCALGGGSSCGGSSSGSSGSGSGSSGSGSSGSGSSGSGSSGGGSSGGDDGGMDATMD